MYLVRLKGTNDYSMFDYICFTQQIEYARKYTLDQAMKLIREIPQHIGVGELVAV